MIEANSQYVNSQKHNHARVAKHLKISESQGNKNNNILQKRVLHILLH